MVTNTTIDFEDKNQFDAIAEQWWNPSGLLKSLHQFTPIRIEYIKNSIKRHHFGEWQKLRPLSNLRILDIGCGGGLLAEPISKLGGIVTGIDSSLSAIEIARQHAKSSELEIDYQATTAERLADEGTKFDVIYASEVIEHVSDRSLFLNSIQRLLTPKGVVIITTINRNLFSFALAKISAEYIFGLIPKGTHDFTKFVKPSELQSEAKEAGIILDDFTGFKPLLDGRFKFTSITTVNYGASGSLAGPNI
ncbi:MAG: ubiquinone biosynthesis O-methyltransferase [Alphaproteobacteria bacterium]|nr:MAG: ubiquinone biosynthesis O-methyltransferase [Alphaproteobacteria bacterium]